MRSPLLLSALIACTPAGPEVTEPGPGHGTEPPTYPEPPAPKPTDPTSSLGALAAQCAEVGPLQVRCAVQVDPPAPVAVTYSRVDGVGLERTHTSDGVAATHEVALWFLHRDAEYRFTATAGGQSVEGTFVTTSPEDAPLDLEVTGTVAVPYVGGERPCGDRAQVAVWETGTGALVWYQLLDPGGLVNAMNMVRFTEDHTVLADTDGSLVEVDLRGEDLLRLELGVDYDWDLHHDLFKRDGKYYPLYHLGDEPQLDGFSVLGPNGLEIVAWDPNTHLAIPPDATGNWMHTNTVFVDDAGDVILSLWAQDSIVKVEGDPLSPDFGRQLWLLAGDDQGGLGQDIEVDWSRVSWPKSFGNQHDVKVRHDGRLMLLDNVHGRALVLTVDEAARTATVDQEYATVEDVCIAQGTAADASTGENFVACMGPWLRAYPDGAAEHSWEARATCDDGTDGVVSRWYPLEGW